MLYQALDKALDEDIKGLTFPEISPMTRTNLGIVNTNLAGLAFLIYQKLTDQPDNDVPALHQLQLLELYHDLIDLPDHSKLKQIGLQLIETYKLTNN